MQIKLTGLQYDILEHRLEVPDALADALDEPPATVAHCCDLLLMGLTAKHLDTQYVELTYPSLHKKVLADCIEGSTYCAWEEGRTRAIVQAGERLAEKIGMYVGRELIFPTW